MRQKQIVLSLVIPLFNEAAVIADLGAALRLLSKQLPRETEIILVDDGSSDHTFQLISQLSLPYQKRVIKLSRNFGHQAALLAGLEKARGEYVVTADGDLQHPLALIPQMLKQHQHGVDIVFTQRITGQNVPLIKRLTATLFYSLLTAFSQTVIPSQVSDFRSLNRKTLDVLLSLPEKRKFLRGMASWIGFTSIILPYSVEPRRKGQSKYTLPKMLKVALEGLTSFSALPLYLAGLFSVGLFVLAAIYALYVLYVKFVLNTAVSGWASVLFVLLLMGSFLSLFLTVIGVYLAAVYDEVKQRPNYIIDQEAVTTGKRVQKKKRYK